MTLLSEIQDLIFSLGELRTSIAALPEENRNGVDSAYANAVSALSTLELSVEKYFQDKALSDQLKIDIYAKMDASAVYDGLSKEEREAMATRILESANKEVLSPVEFSEYILGRLREKSDSDLTKAAYSEQDLISLGKAVTDGVQPDMVYYEAGLEVANNFVQTPSGRDEALARAQKRISSSKALSKEYLKTYYAL